MSKAISTKTIAEINFCKSSFTLTFAFEVLGPESWQLQWEDSKDETLELGPCEHGIKVNYQLYYSQSFDIEIAIWQNVAKVFCGSESCWIRVWPFLQRRWLTFSIRHAFPVRVAELLTFEATITPSVGVSGLSSNAKGDKSTVVHLPPLGFNERRYFGRVEDNLLTEKQLWLKFVKEYIWDLVKDYIPKSFFDGKFDIPTVVTDIRHQDTVLTHIQNEISSQNNVNVDEEEDVETEKVLKDQKQTKEKETKKKGAPEPRAKFEAKLTGDALLAGIGRVVAFECTGNRPADMGAMIALISSSNLPAHDDTPVAFVNVDTLFDAPLEEMRKLGITHLYTRWNLGQEVHDSEHIDIRSKKLVDVHFNDHHSLSLEVNKATQIIAQYLNNQYHIELRGIREVGPVVEDVKLYGYDKTDRENRNVVTPKADEDVDIAIAITRIQSQSLSKGVNEFIYGEYPLYPIRQDVTPLNREPSCTNDINLISTSLRPPIIVPNSLILAAQMSLKVSMGIVGCKPPRLTSCFSRLYFVSSDLDSVMSIALKVSEINESLFKNGNRKDEMLTGFSLDMGHTTMVYLEGPKDRHILTIWELTEEYYPKIKPLFSTAARYSHRIYGESLLKNVPFVVLKMHAPLNLLLSCPAIYARPAMPLPLRNAVLKFGRLVMNSYRIFPPANDLPTVEELKSFRLELCAPHRTFLLFPPQIEGSGPGPGESFEQIPDIESKLVGNKNIIWKSNVP